MEISKFISRSIHQVVKGLLDAQEVVAIKGVDIKTAGGDLGYSEIDFDLAVTTRTTNDKGGNVELSVLGADLKFGKSKDTQHSVASRIKFSVQFSIPEEQMELAAQANNTGSEMG